MSGDATSELSLKIRGYQAGDLPIIRRITADAFDGVSIDQRIEQRYGLINGHDWKWRKARHVDADVAFDPDSVFIAEVDGQIVGVISTRVDLDAGIGMIPNIAFLPDYRGRGLGRKLIEFALARFRKLGLTHARIETLAHNDVGNHLYESIGFQEVVRQIHFALEL
ncbi:MAG: GNAT family N-acetyltransferase [Planctomycetota bacterium]|nr:GNAT family N-acetyltransferase [Planctomycetota bacterium]